MSQVEKVNIIKIYCDKTYKEEISALFTESDLEVGVIHCFSENAPDLLAISFKIGSMAVERLKKVLTMFVKKDKEVHIAVVNNDGSSLTVNFKNVPEPEQAALLERAHAMAINTPKTEQAD
ncbi:hypothetical protein RGO66_002848 [Serratia marcescens]